MIRGVNRRVVEINECKSELFERAIFFVRPTANASTAQMQKEADDIIEALSKQPAPKAKRRYRISRRGIWLLFGLVSVGAAVSLIFNFI